MSHQSLPVQAIYCVCRKHIFWASCIPVFSYFQRIQVLTSSKVLRVILWHYSNNVCGVCCLNNQFQHSGVRRAIKLRVASWSLSYGVFVFCAVNEVRASLSENVPE